ncbi:response regulator transcription factor [Novosphingobium sp. 1949]|uniref:Response regulator transcription factor n=1 Tax=Novosphingobium organovorum TaxID=2930092 RepID=A0ABT0BGF7_9SPHN|nr:response regulator transcription factor [Novosphingobium organovorum]MCJ2184123.1 response regulator transcription factor [Novosphingobium organovorum]
MVKENDAGISATTFQWLAARALPAELDLRKRDWTLVARDESSGLSHPPVRLIDAAGAARDSWAGVLSCHSRCERKSFIVTGVACSSDRAAILSNGFGDAVPGDIGIDELTMRALRVAELAQSLPRFREIGELRLDLLTREAFRGATPLNLNPREFALIWRLAHNINQPVSKQTLIHDVWHMGFIPETNSIAVHMSRLRRKLAFVGIKGIIETIPSGGYALRSPDALAKGKMAKTPNWGNGLAIARTSAPRPSESGTFVEAH